MLASSYWFHPATSTPTGISRAYKATACFALGAILGWPFSAVLGVPFVLEELFTTGGQIAVGAERAAVRSKRWDTMGKAIALAATIAVSAARIRRQGEAHTLSMAHQLNPDPRLFGRFMGIRAIDIPDPKHSLLQPSLTLGRIRLIRNLPRNVLPLQPIHQL